jgi:hypothetical protein
MSSLSGLRSVQSSIDTGQPRYAHTWSSSSAYPAHQEALQHFSPTGMYYYCKIQHVEYTCVVSPRHMLAIENHDEELDRNFSFLNSLILISSHKSRIRYFLVLLCSFQQSALLYVTLTLTFRSLLTSESQFFANLAVKSHIKWS